jgi:hypothetical protein
MNKDKYVIYLLGYTLKNSYNTCYWPWLRFKAVFDHLGYECYWVEKEDVKEHQGKNRIFITWCEPDTSVLINDGIYKKGDIILHKLVLYGNYDSGENWGTNLEETKNYLKNFRWSQYKILEDAYDAGANIYGFGAKTQHIGFGEKERIVERLKDRIFFIPWGSSLYGWEELQNSKPIMENLTHDIAWVGSIWGKVGRGNIDSFKSYLEPLFNLPNLNLNLAGEGTPKGIVSNDIHKQILKSGKLCPIINAPSWKMEEGIMDRFWTVFSTGRFGVVDTKGVYHFFDEDEVVYAENPEEYQDLSKYYMKNIDKQLPYIQKIQNRIKKEYNWYTSWENILTKIIKEN